MELKKRFIDNIYLLNTVQEVFLWELISSKHSEKIVAWRNNPENLKYFENQNYITVEDQEHFLNEYYKYDRIDLLLLCQNEPIGVFNIKNLESLPEYGALIGEESFRNKGIGTWAKAAIFDFWFNVLDQRSIYLKNRLTNTKVVNSNGNKGYEIVAQDKLYVTFKVVREQYLQNKK